MTERERLIEILKSHGIGAETESGLDILDDVAEILLANGVIVPPCKVGDKVYRAVKLVNGEVFVVDGIMFEVASTYEAGTVKTRFYFWANGDEYTRRHHSLWCELTEFDKTVFLTKEEAEQALSKLRAS